ncbi:peptidase U62 modulator of DNA gyrase [Ammonifex degensii KC4]|uniref:Peptidase U62 modulator of DNA gyrase n=1 Tax=Ammonifex degensii (strain DSM 10501 / KC4) TaxID=429009 RepID=C9RC30_AMMDK|nr:TldD/PmbA family protein [Ammonifex degensii]ACX51807.1 peptidase U62 modulator of DNA gyrase [Ammonifex degensii KC4]
MALPWDKAWLYEVLETALARGGDYADIYLEERRSTLISLEDQRVERVHVGVDRGAGVRVLKGDSTVYAYTNDLSREGLLRIAEQAARAVAQEREANLPELKKPDEEVSLPEDVPLEEKVKVVQEADKAAREVSPLIRQVMVSYGDVTQNLVIATSEGELVEEKRSRLRFTVNAVAAEGGVIQTGFEALGSTAGFPAAFKEFPPEELARVAARRAAALVKAPPAPAGKMPVVLAGEAGGTMVHEACGHGLEADLVQKGLSVYKGKLGEQVASEEVTVIDDATLPGKYGSYRYDDEGVKARPVVLIERGVLKEYLYDRRTAAKEGRNSNGHGRRESYQHKPIPRMANTYIAPGEWDPEDIIREVKEGFLVKKMGGGQVNTTNGDFVFEVAEGYLIQDGDVGPLVRGATITGNGPEVLRRVTMVGRDLGFTVGTCGKDGQGVPVSDAQPTLLVPELIVGGTAPAGRR